MGTATVFRTLGTAILVPSAFAAVPGPAATTPDTEPSVGVLVEAAAAALDAGDLEEALSVSRRALQFAPDHPDALEISGFAQAVLGEHDDAEHVLSRACSLRPSRWECLVRLGRARSLRADEAESKGDVDLAAAIRDAALETLERAVALGPEAAEPRKHVTALLLDAGRIDRAIAASEAWIAVAPDDPEPFASLVDAYAAAGRWAGAASVHVRLSDPVAAGSVGLRALDRLVEAGRLREADALVPKLARLRGPAGREVGLEAARIASARSYYQGLDRLVRYLGTNPPPDEAAAISNAVLAHGPKVPHRKSRAVQAVPESWAGLHVPELRVRVEPTYPHALKRSRVEGTAILRVVVRADGSVGRIEIVDSTHPAFSVAAMDAVKQWRFAPAIRLGDPVAAVHTLRVEFRIDGTDRRE